MGSGNLTARFASAGRASLVALGACGFIFGGASLLGGAFRTAAAQSETQASMNARMDDSLRRALRAGGAAPGRTVSFANPATDEPEHALIESVTRPVVQNGAASSATCVTARLKGEKNARNVCFTPKSRR